MIYGTVWVEFKHINSFTQFIYNKLFYAQPIEIVGYN